MNRQWKQFGIDSDKSDIDMLSIYDQKAIKCIQNDIQ
jgi:hypothetical protein